MDLPLYHKVYRQAATTTSSPSGPPHGTPLPAHSPTPALHRERRHRAVRRYPLVVVHTTRHWPTPGTGRLGIPAGKAKASAREASRVPCFVLTCRGPSASPVSARPSCSRPERTGGGGVRRVGQGRGRRRCSTSRGGLALSQPPGLGRALLPPPSTRRPWSGA
jgi:hypothetical protein